ncbi:MAG: MBL fold metallo-hydrolase [Pseudomonadota bacterium]
MTTLSRRAALVGLGATAATTAFAKAPLLGPSTPTHYRFALGAYEVTTIFDGAIQLDGPHPIFGQDQTAEAVAELAAERLLPPTRMEIGFTPVIVNTGSEVILFDAGNGAGRRPNAGALRARLSEVGFTPEQIDIVVLTHFHPDHIGGLMEDGAPAFPNARYVTNALEYDFWSPEDKLSGGTERVAKLTQSNVVPLVEQMSFIDDGEDVASGVTAMAAYGHTPGHTVYHLESGGERLLLGGDFANHYVMSIERPDWHVRFDMDKDAAAATRRNILGMLAAEKIPFTSFHMPFPAVGFIEPNGSTFRYVAASYQLNL